MGIAMTFARVPGPGDLRTLLRGSRIDDGVQGRERRRGYDARRRSRDVGKLRRKSRIAVVRNEEIVFPFVLWKLRDGYMTQSAKNIVINRVIYYVYFFLMLFICGFFWFWLSDPLFSILGINIEDYGRWARFFITAIFILPIVIIACVFHEAVISKLYRYDE